MKVPAGSVPGEGSPPDLKTATFSLCVLTAERAISLVSLIRTPLMGSGPTPGTSVNLNYLLISPISKYIS